MQTIGGAPPPAGPTPQPSPNQRQINYELGCIFWIYDSLPRVGDPFVFVGCLKEPLFEMKVLNVIWLDEILKIFYKFADSSRSSNPSPGSNNTPSYGDQILWFHLDAFDSSLVDEEGKSFEFKSIL